MYNGNSVLGGVTAGGGVLAATGSDNVWLAVLAVLLIVAGFFIARLAGQRSTK
jgi:LPXTG-motif cell wall-anchored protein